MQRLWILAGLVAFPLLTSAASAQPLAPPTSVGDTLVVTINAIPGFRFDRVRFQVAPGRPVRMILNNIDGESEMDHNLVITAPGARDAVVAVGMQATPESQYVPDMPEVLAFTPLLTEGESFELVFDAPAEPGAYPYVCTFPGHGFVMFGVMYVGQAMPPITEDLNVPSGQRTVLAAGEGPPPLSLRELPGLSYGTTFPAISRTFLPQSGPASIAVGLTPDNAYSFDAGAVHLASAWAGGFVDNQPHWRGNGNAYAIVQGTVYYRSQVGFPLRIGARASAEAISFHGYRLIDGGYPEFHYRVDGAEVWETVRPTPTGEGLVRSFRIESPEPVRFVTDVDAGVRFESSAGRWDAEVLELTPDQARQFTVTMTPQSEAEL